MLKLDPKRLEDFVAKNGARYAAFEREARATGIPIPMSTDDKQFEAVDMYCLDAASLLMFVRANRANAEHIIFALLGFSSEEFAAVAATQTDPAAATEVPPLPVVIGVVDVDCA